MRRVASVLALLGLLLLLVWWRGLGPEPLPAAQGETRFSAHRALEVLKATVGGRVPHPLGSAEHRAVRDRIIAHLKGLGYDTEIQRRFACSPAATCAWVENIIASPPGKKNGPAIIAAAHYDSVPAAPGASDDGAGVAVLLEIARILRNDATRQRVIFLIDDGEEVGLLGAEAFVQDAPEILAVVNVEARGTSGQSYLFETSRRNARLAPLVARALPRPVTTSLFATIYDQLPNDTDLTVFKRAGLEGVNFGIIGSGHQYHTPQDNVANLDLRTLQHQGDNALAAVRALANTSSLRPADADAVWFDVLGLAVISWRDSWSLWLACGFLLVSLVAAIRLGNSGRTALGLAAFVASLLVTGLSAYAVAWLSMFRHGETTWVAQPMPALAASWIVGIIVPIAAASLVRRRLSFDELFAAHAIGWSVFAVLFSLRLTGASYLAIVPAAVMAIAAMLRGQETLRAAAAAIAAAALFFPLILVLYEALGRPALIAVSVMMALIATAFSPLAERITRRTVVAVSAIIVGLAVVSSASDTYTASRPRRVNVMYLVDGERSYWAVNAVPPRLEQFGFKERLLVSPWLANRRPQYAAVAPSLRLPLPDVQVVSDSSSAGGRTIRFIVTSRRAANRVVLALRSDARVRTLRVNGIVPSPRTRRSSRPFAPGWTRTSIRGESAEVEVTYERAAPIDLIAADYSFGLPPQGLPIARMRDASAATQSDDGDLTTTMRRMRLP